MDKIEPNWKEAIYAIANEIADHNNYYDEEEEKHYSLDERCKCDLCITNMVIGHVEYLLRNGYNPFTNPDLIKFGVKEKDLH